MTPSERTVTIGTLLGFVVFVAYWSIIGVRAATDGLPFSDVAWEGPLLLCLCVGGGLYIAATIVSRRVPKEDRGVDQRDRDIARFGSARDGELTSLTVLICLIMMALGAEMFWVANVLFTGSYLASLAGGLAQIGAYKNGVPNE